MNKATVTIRELKNKETGIDLSVTSYMERKSMLGSVYEYQVMVASNLPVFKSAKHKDADNVQFTVMKKMSDFEELFTHFNTKYSGTAFPPLPKKVLMMNETVARQRRNNLDRFLRFLACTPKLCTDQRLLVFLGVSNIRASSEKLTKLAASDKTTEQTSDSTDTAQEKDGEVQAMEEDENLFAVKTDSKSDEEDEEEDLFGPGVSARKGEMKLFEDPDLEGGIEDGEGEYLFIAGSSVEPKVKDTKGPDEDVAEELFSSDDDLDEIMDLKISKRPGETEKEDTTANFRDIEGKVPDELEVNVEEMSEEVKPKPMLRPKPAVPKRGEHLEKTGLTKGTDSVAEPKTDTSNDGDVKVKPDLKKKPALGKKPVLKPKPGAVPSNATSGMKSSEADSPTEDESKTISDLTESDIMKYIQDNATANDDLELFS